MKNKSFILTIISILCMFITVGLTTYNIVEARYSVNNIQGKTYNIPSLSKGEYYEVVLGTAQSMTCVDLENELGLSRGDVAQMSTDADGTITITFKKDYYLTDYHVSVLEDKLALPLKEIKVVDSKISSLGE